jgi:hypothetical protein
MASKCPESYGKSQANGPDSTDVFLTADFLSIFSNLSSWKSLETFIHWSMREL